MPSSLNQQRAMPKPLSWNLHIDSTIVVVTGSMTVGSVMVQLVNRLGSFLFFFRYRLINLLFFLSLEKMSHTISLTMHFGGLKRIFG
jgi:hypothetical protein